jgi:hypothetical protein
VTERMGGENERERRRESRRESRWVLNERENLTVRDSLWQRTVATGVAI